MATKNFKIIETLLNKVNYSDFADYVPSKFALEMVNFIKLVSSDSPEENKTPIIHLKILDKIANKSKKIANLLFRGAAKSTLMEFLIFYIAIYNKLPGMDDIRFLLYVSDTVDNGVKTMRESLEYRYKNSSFLQKYLPQVKFNDQMWKFTNAAGKEFVVKAYGVKTGIRGGRALGTRPQIAFIDDILSDQSASSKAEITAIRKVINRALDKALHPTKRLIIWNGTPFSEDDPLYSAIESGTYDASVFPVAEKFDETTTRETFRSAWPDRWTYEAIKNMYDEAMRENELASFNQEMMMQIAPEGKRLVDYKRDFVWFNGEDMQGRYHQFNFYITTDLATSTKTAANWTVIGVWAYTNGGQLLLIDAVLDHITVEKAMSKIFDLVIKYRVQEVTLETNGQQDGFVGFFQTEMTRRNVFFRLTEIKRNTDKFAMLNGIVPRIKAKMYWINEKIYDKTKPEDEKQFLEEMEDEFKSTTLVGIKAKNDDVIDMITATQFLHLDLPDPMRIKIEDDPFAEEEEQISVMDSYVV